MMELRRTRYALCIMGKTLHLLWICQVQLYSTISSRTTIALEEARISKHVRTSSVSGRVPVDTEDGRLQDIEAISSF